MASLYATATHRGLQITWTGVDLTGLAGTALHVVFANRETGARFQGTGAFSAPVTTTVNGKVQATTNYTPSAADVAVTNEGEWLIQLNATYGDGTVDYSTFDHVSILPIL